MSLALNEAVPFNISKTKAAIQIRKAVTKIGLQSNHELWVMGEGVQIDAHGETVPVEHQSHIWLDWSVQQGLGTVSLKEVLPTVMVPLIHTAFRLLSQLMKHNFIPSILMMSGRVMIFSTFCTCDDPFYPCITPLFLAARLS